MMMNKSCAQCGEQFEKKPSCSVKDWSSVRFCSKACYTNHQQTVAVFSGRRYSGDPWNKGVKLGPSPRKTMVSLSCAQCQQPFEVKKYRASSATCCSKKCSYAYRDKGLTDANERDRKSTAAREWRNAVFQRDDFTCRICGCRGGTLNADHIKPFAFFPALRFDLNNGRTLCEPCHKATPTFGVGAWRVAQEA